MKKDGYYSSGQFAKMAHVSLRTIRYYDKLDLLNPTLVTEAGARFYTDHDLAKLQQILLFKYLGFSLDEIKELTIKEVDESFIANSLNMQLKLVKDRIEQMQLVERAIENTSSMIAENKKPQWNQLLELIHLTGIETSIKSQYQDASNISARIRLHKLYSQNKEKWFPWIYKQLEECCDLSKRIDILEIGCGNGSFWVENFDKVTENMTITLSDKSEGMVRDARRAIGINDKRYRFDKIDCHEIPYNDGSFDVVIANHVMFYCKDMDKALSEIRRVLGNGGIFICSTYGANHMKEISQLVQRFDGRIVLSAEKLYELFGLENGKEILKPYFSSIECKEYEDYLKVTNGEHLTEYIISCHGNQNQYLLDRYKEFRNFVEPKTQQGFHITKQAGLFICEK